MPTMYIHTTSSSEGGEPESNEEWCHHSDVVTTVSFNCVTRNSGSGFWACGDSFEVSQQVFQAEKVFLVIVRYYDGGTFGRTTGLWRIQEAFTTGAEALLFAEKIRSGEYEKECEEKSGRYNHYLCWTGYFAGLEDVEVHCFSVKDEPASLGQTKVIYH